MHFFTDPYEDEIFYSMISRFHFYSNNTKCSESIRQLLNCSKSIINGVDFIGRTQYLVNRCLQSMIYTTEYFILNNSILPLFYPFISAELKEYFTQQLTYNSISNLIGKINNGTTGRLHLNDEQAIYYCPACVEEDITNFGESYIHRAHQIYFIQVCPKHLCYLNKIKLLNNKDIKQLITLHSVNVSRTILFEEDNSTFNMLKLISKSVLYILNNDFRHIDQDEVHRKYNTLMKAKGIVDRYTFYDTFTSFFEPRLLDKIQFGNDKANIYMLYCRIIKPNRINTINPIIHILLIIMLYGNIEGFFKDIQEKFRNNI